MSRHVLLLDLIDDAALIAAYEARHAPGAVWPEVVRDIRARGVRTMEIWRAADRLVMIIEAADDYPRPADPAWAATVARWEGEMDRFQRPIAPDDGKWLAAAPIFSLDAQRE